jgi:hypothetical protein
MEAFIRRASFTCFYLGPGIENRLHRNNFSLGVRSNSCPFSKPTRHLGDQVNPSPTSLTVVFQRWCVWVEDINIEKEIKRPSARY